MTRVIVITGGTAGVGRATARRFAREGAAIAVLARGHDGLHGTVADIMRLGGIGLPIETDVAHHDEVEAAAARVEDELGPIDVWINNAATTAFGPLDRITPEEFRRVTDVCYHGYVWGTQAALARMRPRNHGTILQIGSALAYRSIPLQAAECGAKHAILGFTDAVRTELLHDQLDITLCMIQLPAVNTPQLGWCVNKMDNAPQPVPPIFQPELIAEAIHRASLHPRREIFVGWPTIEAILGNEIAPGRGDHYLAERGYEAQLSDRPNAHAPANLFAPVTGDHGAHGSFDTRTTSSSALVRASTALGAAGTRAVLAAAATVIGAVVVYGVARLIRLAAA